MNQRVSYKQRTQSTVITNRTMDEEDALSGKPKGEVLATKLL